MVNKDQPSNWMLQEAIYIQSTQYSMNLTLSFLFKIWEYAPKITFQFFIPFDAPLDFALIR